MQHVFEESRKTSLLYRRIETCGKPWVAAINGVAVGGGFELTLACHHRVAADNDKTRVGLPEIKVGLFPGAGGTQRVARILPPADALQFLLKGDQISANRAKTMKLVDEVVPAGDLGESSQGVDHHQRHGEGAVGYRELQAARRTGAVEGRHDGVHAGQRHLSPRDL